MPKQELKDTLSVRRLIETNQANLKDQVVSINRVTKVVKGGKNLSFSALVVVGDQGGHAGFGMGKAREVPMAIRKAIEQAKKNMVKLNLKGTTIPHQVLGRYGSGQVLLKPAPEGTGVIAGGPVRAVMEVAGIHNVLTKSLGTSNPHNVIKATFDALLHLKDAAKVAESRGRERRKRLRSPSRFATRTMATTKKKSGTLKIKWVGVLSAARAACGKRFAAWVFAGCSRWWSSQDTPAIRGMIAQGSSPCED